MRNLLKCLFILSGLMLATMGLFPIMTVALGGNWYSVIDPFNYAVIECATAVWIIITVVYKFMGFK